ncbi:tRNA lysidine(34) synthetase TilS [Belnapia sp. T6]|uniref:tRNA(Ile)-lysidine synthase n=1 Tax=Belnapia mucosa TaxID=2804532 RepID=A0ABS1V4T0_9PROT|nr:tRNA lysidine(34) synthetase TilS [Belnapia mucosa]MBL6456685.1 tRNA lysidine(34) synthetase TilS [Belnapia mucosa]
MAPLGPFGPAPALAAGISGGPDSLALALLAAEWARARGGSLLGLVVDHGLRPESGAETAATIALLAARGIEARLLPLGLPAGSRLQERAREARLTALLEACRAAGRPWLLLGHQQRDQAETLLFRALRGSGPDGLAGMAAARPAGAALILRPLLGIPPARLEAVVAAAGLAPLRDPSNADPRFARVRLRAVLGEGEAVPALAEAAAAFARRRGREAGPLAARLAAAARLHPEGFAEIDPAELGKDRLAEAALAALLRAVGGGRLAPGRAATAALLERGQGSLAGAVLRPRTGGWLLRREVADLAPPVPARTGTLWDGRFRLVGPGAGDCSLGALGPAAAGLRRLAPGLPAAVLSALPSIWCNGVLVAVPGLDYPDPERCTDFATVFAPAGGPVLDGAFRDDAVAMRPQLSLGGHSRAGSASLSWGSLALGVA